MRLKNLITNLSPGYLRVGGTLADKLFFCDNNNISFVCEFNSNIPNEGDEIINDVYQEPNFTLRSMLLIYI